MIFHIYQISAALMAGHAQSSYGWFQLKHSFAVDSVSISLKSITKTTTCWHDYSWAVVYKFEIYWVKMYIDFLYLYVLFITRDKKELEQREFTFCPALSLKGF